MTFITDLPWAEKLTPQFRENLEDFLPRWLTSLLPYYQEGKKQSVDILHIGNFLPNGCESEETMYEHNGIDYYLHQNSDGLKTLGFNSKGTYRKCNWLECFIEEHPDYDTASNENFHNSLYYNSPMSRINNRHAEYSELADRCDAYFKELTGDATVGFSLSRTSMIYYNQRGKDHIYYYCLHD